MLLLALPHLNGDYNQLFNNIHVFYVGKCLINVLPVSTGLLSLPPKVVQTCNYLNLGDMFGKYRTSELIFWGLEMTHRVLAGLGFISCLRFLRQLSAESLSSCGILVWRGQRPHLGMILLSASFSKKH